MKNTMKLRNIIWLMMLTGFLFQPNLNAQNYQQICTSGETYFKYSTNYLMSFRQDSATAIAGSSEDTLFWSYRIIQGITGNPQCYDTIYGSALGRKILKKSNGWFVFFNYLNDSIWINTQANPGETWQLMKLGDTGYFMASVASVTVEDILGNLDSIKTITLQAENQNSQPIGHPLNGETIKLSKTYGLTRIYPFTKFPFESTPLFLAGKTNPSIGCQDFSFFDCYNFDIGDEFHISESSNYNYKRIIKTLLEKSTSITGDTLTFKWDLCYYEDTQGGPYIDHGIVYEIVSPQTCGIYTVFHLLPNEFFPISYYCHNYGRHAENYNSRSTKTFQYLRFKMYTCWVDYDNDLSEYYSDGLGMTYYRHGYWWQNQGGFWVYVVVKKKLEYYNKGGETWGTPFAPDCWTLTGTDEQKNPTDIDSELILYPNPSSTTISLETPERGTLSIYNLQGDEIIRKEIVDLKTTIDIRELKNGMYPVRIVGEKGVHIGRFVKN